MTNDASPPWVVKPIVPDEVYTDREEFLDYFYKAALDAAGRRTMSTVLLGQRRMGILKCQANFSWKSPTRGPCARGFS